METAAAYIPMDRRQAIARGRALPDTTGGAALFADISGFTALMEALSRALGPRRGAEELTRCLNDVYDALIAEIHRYGGSVIGFAGDAMTCWFDHDPGPRAAACALAMQEAMRRFEAIPIPPAQSVALAAKAAVAAGPARRFEVGDPEIQRIDVLAGATLARVAEAEHTATKGDVVLDEAAVAGADGAARVAEWRVEPETGRRFAVVPALARPVADAPWPEPGVLTQEQARPWLLPPVYERVHSGQGAFLAELRPVVTLFLAFSGIDYDADMDAAQRLDAYIRWVQRVLDRYGGHLLQIIIGDKGSYLYAAFGAPVAHGDDATRAVAASLELQEPHPALHNGAPRIGIAEGRAYAGAYGGQTRRTYGILGDAVNLAARLMQSAPAGGILASDGVHRAAARGFTWESLPPLRLKGKSELVAAFRLIAAVQRRVARLQEPRYTLPLVGRQAELAAIEEALTKTLSGRGQIVSITAEAGMGKSRLVAEAVRLATARELGVYIGECQSYGANTSYLVWESIWRTFFGLDGVDSLDEQLDALKAQLAAIDPALVPRLPLLGVALNLPIPDNDLTRSLDAKLRKTSLEALLVDCLRARAMQAPLLLVLDDCHWLDPLSHDLLEAVGRGMADLPVLLVVAYRPPEIERLQAPRIVRLPHCTQLELTSFTPQEAERLIALKLAQLTGSGDAPPAMLLKRIAERAQGNPFYSEELLNYLHDRGLDARDAQALESLELPASLHSLILSRIDQLSESQKITIKVASVVGRQFRMDWLWGVHPQLGAPTQVKADLDGLSRLDLTPLDQPEPERIYLFKHIATREVAHESMPYAMRAQLHGQLAQFIEDSYATTLDQYVDLLAYHYDLSRVEPKKREYLRRAGEAAQSAYANEAAIDYYRRLLPLLPEVEQSAIRLRLGQVLELVGEWSEAGEHYRQALHLAEQFGDARSTASCRRAMGWLLRKQGKYHEAISWLIQARLGFEQLGDLAVVSLVMTDIGEISRQLGAFTEAKKRFDDALSLAQSLGDYPEGLMAQAQALKGAGTLANQQGDSPMARTFYEQSLAIRRELNDRPGIAVLLANLGIVSYHTGDYAGARTLDDESLAVFREIGDGWSAGTLLNNLGDIAREQADYPAARQFLAESLEVRRRLGDMGGTAFSLNSLGDVLLDEGDHPAARPVLAESLAINRELGDRAAIAYLLDDFAALATAEGEPQRALRLAGAASAAHDAIGSQLSAGERARFDRLQARAWQALGEPLATAAWGEGRAMTLEQAVEYALAHPADAVTTTGGVQHARPNGAVAASTQ